VCYDSIRHMAFREVVGHRTQVRLISSAVDRESLPPSLLFVGPDGVGKRLVAIALAQALNCTARVRSASSRDSFPVDGCGKCSACIRIARWSHPDVPIVESRVLRVDSERNRDVPPDVDRVREVLGEAMYRPFEGRRRVIVFNDADRLTPAAQSALLKMLEEPPDSSQCVLITARPDMLLPTVRSRCSRLTFGQLGTDEVLDALVRGHKYEKKKAQTAAESAGGSLGRALLLVSDELDVARDAAIELLRKVAEATDTTGRLQAAKEFVPKANGTKYVSQAHVMRQKLSEHLRVLGSVVRDMAAVGSGADKKTLANVGLRDKLVPLVTKFEPPRCVNAGRIVDEALKATDRNVNPKVITDWLACQL